jgi:hypothetical protein
MKNLNNEISRILGNLELRKFLGDNNTREML